MVDSSFRKQKLGRKLNVERFDGESMINTQIPQVIFQYGIGERVLYAHELQAIKTSLLCDIMRPNRLSESEAQGSRKYYQV